MRALYNYKPADDSLLPCKDIGLAFNSGDVLQVKIIYSNSQWTLIIQLLHFRL